MKTFIKSKGLVACTLFSMALWTGCSNNNDKYIAETHAPAAITTSAIAVIHPTEGNKVQGTVRFTTVPGGTKIVAEVSNLTPGKHGFHVHEFGDCSAHDASSAGGHFNPTKTKHGGPDSAERHMGDLGNLDADKDGHAHYERIDDMITLSGPNSIIGKSVVVHADEDDFVSQPTGNSGPRIGCGAVVASEE